MAAAAHNCLLSEYAVAGVQKSLSLYLPIIETPVLKKIASMSAVDCEFVKMDWPSDNPKRMFDYELDYRKVDCSEVNRIAEEELERRRQQEVGNTSP